MLTHPLTITPITTALGVEIAGVDLSRPLEPAELALIRKAYCEHGAVFFRDQPIDSDAYLAFARQFGPITFSKVGTGIDGHNEIGIIWKDEGAHDNLGSHWHTDQACREVPVMGTMLIARKIPASGGDTMFVNMTAAFDALSEGVKQTLRPLRGVQSNLSSARHVARRAQMGVASGDESVHPVVGKHPETGRETLFVNPTYTVRFDGWTEAESKPLLEMLFAHALRPEFGLRFRWSVGTIGFWDNRQCWHYAVNDYPGGERILHRVMVEGPFLQ
jgi:taurine dioxygenase